LTAPRRATYPATVRHPIHRRIVYLFAVLLLGSAITEAAAQTIPRPPRKGTRYRVTIDSSPQQAAIYIDDKQYGIVGYTPYRGTLVRGDYKLIVELPGFQTIERPITIVRGKNDYFFPLVKKEQPGTIDVQAAADPNLLGAQVFVDGVARGTVPATVEVPKGRHLLEIKKDKFNDYAQWVEVAEGTRVTVAPALKTSAKGSLLIDADVEGATVSVDGKRLDDTAPVLVDDLEEGAHVVEVSKPPAVPWKQTVYVKAGQRGKVSAELRTALQQAEGGNVRVIASVADAEIWVDGIPKGKGPLDLKGLAPGLHLIEARAEGYDPKEEKVTVNAGSATIVKIDLVESTGPRGPAGKLKIVSPVPEATVYIDGASVGMAPLEKDVTAGEHFVMVEKPGFAKFERKVNVEARKTLTVTAELRAVGAVRFITNPEAAEVFVDGERIGRTPLVKDDIAVGDHLVSFRLEGHRDFDQSVKVDGGKMAIVSTTLRPQDSLTASEVQEVVRGLSSYGAMTVPGGRFTVDASVGYPYLVETRATVGIPGLKPLGLDVMVGFRSLLTTWEFLGGAKIRFVRNDPFALAVFGQISGGGGAAGRSEFGAQAGVVGSITFNNLVTVSARGYLDMWSDRLCKEPEGSMTFSDSGPDVCKGVAPQTDLERAAELAGDDFRRDRDSGARFYMSLVVEAGIAQNFNVFGIFEGAAFQDARAAHDELFNSTLFFGDDPIYNFRLGLTFKF
jgi:hypothetical protein